MNKAKQIVSEAVIVSEDGDAFDAGDVVSYINLRNGRGCLGVIRSVTGEYAEVDYLDSNRQPTGECSTVPLISLTEYNIDIPGVSSDDDDEEEDSDGNEVATVASVGELDALPAGIDGNRASIYAIGEDDGITETETDLSDLTDEDWLKFLTPYGDLQWHLVAETVPTDAPDEDFAYVPNDNKSDRKLYIGDKTHAHEAAVAVGNGEYRGEKLDIPASAMPGIKRKVAGAVRKYFSGADQKYLLTWIKTGKKPEKKPTTAKETASEFGPLTNGTTTTVSVTLVGEFDAAKPAKKSLQEVTLSTPDFTFRGKYPDVPTSPAVNIDELTDGDSDPMYVYRPLAVIGGVSENNLEYDKALVNSIQEQVLTKRPPARLGHISEEAASYEFPLEVGLWVGAALEGNTLWGKCYVYPSDGRFREMIRKRKAAGSGISNSIWGKGDFSATKGGTQRCTELQLESIDFAPPERAALQALGKDFQVTAEMKNTITNEKANKMTTQTGATASVDVAAVKKYLHEMDDPSMALTDEEKARIARTYVAAAPVHEVYEMLTDEQKDHVMGSRAKEHMPQKVSEMLTDEQKKFIVDGSKEHGKQVSELTSMSSRMAEMEKIIKEYQDRDYDRAIDGEIDTRFASWTVFSAEDKLKLADVKTQFKLNVVAQMAGAANRNDVKSIVDQAWERSRTILEMAKAGFAGPSAFVAPVENMKPDNAYKDVFNGKHSDPDAAKAARAALGF